MTFEPGDAIRDYRILARLRAGGMATLYLAQRRGAAGFKRPVAIKVIHPHLAHDQSFVRMFVDEGMLCARIVDPHVVHVEELAEHQGTLFLAMEYVHGCSLAQVMRALVKRERRMSTELAVDICARIASGLHAAHETRGEQGESLGVVHRDVSPQNVLLSYGGHVKVIDFGIAKARGQSRATQTGSLKGKIAYMPPEQAYGRPINRRADIYALGIVLWQLLTMRRMFEADNELALLEMVRKPNVARPSTIVPEIPPALDDAVMAALAPEAADRPATAKELRRMLLDAVPAAHAIDPSDLSAFLHALIPEEKALPSELSIQLADTEPAAPSRDEGERILGTLTAQVADPTFVVDRDEVDDVVTPIPRSRVRGSRRTVVAVAGAALVAAAATAAVLRLGPPPASARGVESSAAPSGEAPVVAALVESAAASAVAEPAPAPTASAAATATVTAHAKGGPVRPPAASSKAAGSSAPHAPPILGNPYAP